MTHGDDVSEDLLIQPTSTEIPATAIPTETATHVPTSPPAVSQNSTALDVEVAASISDDCLSQNTTLPTYTVQSGDTLTAIASRSSSSVNELMQLNCLDNAELIAVGQQLYVPNVIAITNQGSSSTNNTSQAASSGGGAAVVQSDTTIDLANIPTYPSARYGSIIPSSWVVNHENIYIINENSSIRLTWSYFPSDLGVEQMGFVIEPNNKIGGYTLVGTDTNLADGVSAAWTVPENAQVDVFAVGKVPGQAELIVSERIRLGARNPNQTVPSRAYGTSSVSPTLQTISPAEVIVTPNIAPITIEWIGPTSFNYRVLDRVTFYYRNDRGETSVIGVDDNDDDGIAVQWNTFPDMAGIIYAEGEFVQFAPQATYIKLTMPEIRIDAQVEGCMFYGFGLGAPHPVHVSPDRSSEVLTEIVDNIVYPVIEQGSAFRRINVDGQSGWVDAGRGALTGDC